MPNPVTGVSELVLEVADLTAAERFYAGPLGLPVVERWPDREVVWLMAGGRTRIGLWRPQVGAAGGRGGAHVHFALHIPEAAFDAAVERLRTERLEPEVTGRKSNRSVYVYDPDGNCVELWTQDVSEFAGTAFPEQEWSTPHFNATAQTYDRSYDKRSLKAHRRQARLETVLRLLGDERGALLEVGTGTGRLLAALHERGWTVWAIDASPGMVDIARARVPADVAERVTVARAEDIPFANGEFDAVVAIGVLEYTDMDRALRELVRVLRPGGRAVIGLRSGAAPAAIWQRKVVHPLVRRVKAVASVGRALPKPRRRPLPLARVRELLAGAGFVVECVEPVGATVLPDPLDHLAPTLAYRAARSAERSRRLRRVFGTQRVILARKR